MRWAVLFLPLITSALAQPAETPMPTPPIDPKIEFKVSIVGNRHEFHMGEIIPIKLAFSSQLKNRYRIDEAEYDRVGRMNIETFTVTPADGAVDPLEKYFRNGISGLGGITNFSFLKPKPWTIQLNLNEWVRFTKPGEYKLNVSSGRVGRVDARSRSATEQVTAVSNVITLKILPPDPAWEKQVFEKGAAARFR